MGTRRKRKAPANRTSPSAVRARRRPGERDWPRLIGEAILIILAFVIPVATNRFSSNPVDAKDFALGIGVALGLALVLITSLARGKLRWSSVRLNALVTAYLVVAAVSVIYSHYRFATISGGAKLAGNVGLYWLVALAVREMRQVRRIVGAAAVAAVAVCLYAFVQAAGKDPLHWDTSATRVFSFLGNATYLAGFLVLVMPLVIAAGWPRRGGGAAPRGAGAWLLFAFSAVVAGMMLVCLYLTISLSPAIGLLLGVGMAVLLVVIRGGRRAVRIAVPAVAAGLAVFLAVGYFGYTRLPRSEKRRVQQVLHFQDPYGTERGFIRGVGVDIFRERPLFGRAYGTYPMYGLEKLSPIWYGELQKPTSKMLVPNYAHNEFVEVLAETGVIGGLVFLALILLAFAGAVWVSVRHPEPDWARLGFGITVGMTAFMVQNMFGVTFRETGAVAFFWLSLGLLAVAQARMQGPAEGAPGSSVRERTFRPLSTVPIAGTVIAAMILITALAWLGVRPLKSNVLVRQAEAAAKQGRHQEAARLGDRALSLNPYSVRAYYVVAFAWGSLGDTERSMEANKKALAVLPGNASVYYNLGVNYKQLGRLEEARKSFARAIELMPTSMRHHAAVAETLLEMGRYSDALPYAEEAVRLDPTNAGARLLLADIQSRRGDLAASAAQLEEAARLAPDDLSVLPKLAQFYLRLGDYGKAITTCDQWLRLSPDSPRAYALLGVSRYMRKDYVAASAALRRAVELDPNDRQGRLHLAFSCLRLKQYPLAKTELQWLASRYPQTEEGKKAAQLLEMGSRQPASGTPGGSSTAVR